MNQTIRIILLLLTALPLSAQQKSVTLSGKLQDKQSREALAFANVVLKKATDSSFVKGTISNEEGLFALPGLAQGNYVLRVSLVGYETKDVPVLVGQLSDYLDLGGIGLSPLPQTIQEVVVSGQQETVGSKLDKKTYNLAENLSQSGGSVLQAMSNLPGVGVSQEGKVLLRGSDRVLILIDGQQTALTGFDSQKGLDNIPASAIERIEVINNPSAKHEANGNAGIVNIIFKKNNQQGFHGRAGMTFGLGALWEKQENIPDVGPQFKNTPKINPSLSVNYRKNKYNIFFQGDWLHTKTLNKNEFSTRTYTDGTVIHQQIRRNRTTGLPTLKTGLDYYFNPANTLTVSGFYSQENIDDRGDNPYFLNDYTNRYRLWQFIEDEIKYTAAANAVWAHKFKQAGHTLNIAYNYSFHREDEKYFFTNTLPTFVGKDAFKLLSDEYIHDIGVDYVKPFRQGRIETGMKLRRRSIPVNMQFFPGINSPIDSNAGGWANYYETIPALYGNYVYEAPRYDIEAGLRFEYVNVDYQVNPNHNTYKSDGYAYTQPFPNLRFTYKLNDQNKLSLFYNRRVDRPNEIDIRIFPKYDEPELIKVGNPALKPQFTNTIELGYKNLLPHGSIYAAAYHRMTEGTIVRIATKTPGSPLLYNVFQNMGRSSNTGFEGIYQQNITTKTSFNLNVNVYHNIIEAHSGVNQYPEASPYQLARQALTSGNAKLNLKSRLPRQWDMQVSAIYYAPDIIPQGRIGSRFTCDLGLKKNIQHGKGELLFNASDLFNTLNIATTITGADFEMKSTNYYETQVYRLGYSYKF